MACYHCSVKVLGRSSGRSSVQFSAYMSGEKLYDERLGQSFSHTSKEEVCYTEMFFADRVPEHMREQEKFWNSVEHAEKQANAQVSRTWEIALPHELTMEQNERWIRDFAQSLIDKDGMPAVQLAIHEKEGNWHAHLMAPTRDMDEQGKWLAKTRKDYKLDANGERIPIIDPKTGEQKLDGRNRKQWARETVERNNWNSKDLLANWRERTAYYQNRGLEMANQEIRVDHRSLEAQGIDREPTIHEGYTARLMGEESERVQRNMAIRQRNIEMERARIEYEHEQSILEQAQSLWRQWTQNMEEKIAYVKEQIATRIDRIGDRLAGREVEQLAGRDRGDAEQLRGGDIRAEIERQRSIERESEKIAGDSIAQRQDRDIEQERLAAEKIERELERSREITIGFGR